ncbi:MAG: hypothetical protein ACK5IQ_02135 [Bacteroidales bacterium]
MSPFEKIKANFYWLPSFVMVGFAVFKLFCTSSPIAIHTNDTWLDNMLIYIGVIELISVILYLFTPTLLIGFSLICAFLGAAIGIGLVTQNASSLPTILLLLFGLSLYWRAPQLFSCNLTEKQE